MRDRESRRVGESSAVHPLWEEDPVLCGILAESESVDEAGGRLLEHLDDLETAFRIGALDVNRMERSCALQWNHAVKEMLSPENESLAGFSTMELLWRAVRGDTEDVAAGFMEEFVHIFRAIAGRSGIGRGWADSAGSEFPITGRRAGMARSKSLDAVADRFWDGVRAHPCGLDPELRRERLVNRESILARLGGSDTDWSSWQWQARHVLRGEQGARLLQDLVPLTGEEAAAVHLAVRYGIPWGITPHYLSLFDFDRADRSRDGQIRAQVLPPIYTVRAMIEHRADRDRAFDFMRERDTSPIDRITRRYPAVVVLKVSGTCPQICTYCQRDWEIDDAMDMHGIPSSEDLEPALRWIEEHPAITDILLTGGDPLVLSDHVLQRLFERLMKIPHISHVRVGTRVPVTAPMRITDRLARSLGGLIEPGRRSAAIVTHVESASEVTAELAAAVDRLRHEGIALYNQQVFTFETSRRFQTVATRLALKRVGIDPYYTFYTKGKDEHRDYLVPVARLVQERKEEARLLPGVFRTDEPVFNVPGLGKNHLRAQQDRELIGIRADGCRVYLFHPWEKGISPVAPWAYVDASIAEYLERLRSRGEDPRAYESIWYYI